MEKFLGKDICSYPNDTFAMIDPGLEQIFAVRNNKIIGILGKCVDKVLCKLEKRKCSIIGRVDLGKKLDNGTYTGTLGLLQSGKVDMYLKPEPHYTHEPWLQRSLPLKTENLIMMNRIDDERMDGGFFDLSENLYSFETTIFISFAISFFFFILITFFLVKMTRKKSKRETVVFLMKSMNEIDSKTLILSVTFLFFHIFAWFMTLFLTNNIQTNQIVVDTSDLIKSKNDVLNLKRVACFIEGESEHLMAANSPKGTFLRMIFDEKTLLKSYMKREKKAMGGNKCFFKKTIEMAFLIRSYITLVISESASLFLLIFFGPLTNNRKVWTFDKEIHEFNVVQYYTNLRNPLNTQYFTEAFYLATERGFINSFYKCSESAALSVYGKTMRVFKNVDEFMNAFGAFSDLIIENFKNIFIVYLSVCCLTLLIFLIHWIIILIKYRNVKTR